MPKLKEAIQIYYFSTIAHFFRRPKEPSCLRLTGDVECHVYVPPISRDAECPEVASDARMTHVFLVNL